MEFRPQLIRQMADNAVKKTGDKPRNRGNPRARDTRRMTEYNTQRAGDNWADQSEVAERTPAEKPPNKNALGYQKRQEMKAAKNKQTSLAPAEDTAITRDNRKAVKESAPRDDDMWSMGDFTSTLPRHQLYSQNVDMSTLPLLVRATYTEMERHNPKLGREMPFCAYQHYVTSIASAYLIDHSKVVNRDARFQNEESPSELFSDCAIPAIIADYLSSFTTSRTVEGDVVRMNFPTVAVPSRDIPDHCGAFGDVNAASHNAYESYPCPFVTWRLVERTLWANTQPFAAANYAAWNPFEPEDPNAGHQYFGFPANAVCTPNLMGYNLPERLSPEAINRLVGLNCNQTDSTAGQILFCTELNARCSNSVRRTFSKVHEGFPKPIGEMSCAYVVSTQPVLANTNLAMAAAEVRCPYSLGTSMSNKVGIFGNKRQRTATEPGPAMLINGAMPAGWAATINVNFEMQGLYAPINSGVDRASLRENNFYASCPVGDRLNQIYKTIERGYRVQRECSVC